MAAGLRGPVYSSDFFQTADGSASLTAFSRVYAALCQRQRGEHGVGEQLNLPAYEIGERRRSAFVGDHQRVEARVALEQLDSEMAGGADGRGAEGVFLRVLAHEREEI